VRSCRGARFLHTRERACVPVPVVALLIPQLYAPNAVVVKDWDRLTNPDEVGRVVIPSETLLSFLQQREAATEEGSFAVLKEVRARRFVRAHPSQHTLPAQHMRRAYTRTHWCC
jgi:hypothetical protein